MFTFTDCYQKIWARPCTGCTKKGYGPEQCIDGCEPCRRARARCEGGKPCQRCREMQIECLEDVAVPLRHEMSSNPTSSRAPRGGATDRAKLACTNCRRDNKKVCSGVIAIPFFCLLQLSLFQFDRLALTVAFCTSAMTSARARGVLPDRRNAFTLGVVRSL